MLAYSLCSGSSGNSYFIRGDASSILIDAGRSARYITSALCDCGSGMGEISAVFVTHNHSDHISALPVLCRQYAFDIFCTPGSADALLGVGIPESRIRRILPGNRIAVGDFSVCAFETPHDACGSVCYRVSDGCCSLAVATDIGYVSDPVFECLFGCSAVAVESNHDIDRLRRGPYPVFLKQRILSDSGHLSNDRCAALLPRLYDSGTRHFLLAHLSRENNDPDLAFETASRALSGCDAELAVALPEKPVCFFRG